MSSEMYVRWEIRNLENMHRQLMQQLAIERQHQAEMFRQMMGNISSIQAQLVSTKTLAENGGNPISARKTRLSNISDYETEDISSSGYDSTALSQMVVVVPGRDAKRDLVAIDWSAQLDSFEAEISDAAKKAAYARSIGARLSVAVITTEEDIKTLNNFVSYLNDLLNDNELDYEYFHSLVDRRFEQLRSAIDATLPESEDDELFEYYALCEMLGLKPQQVKESELKKSIKILSDQLFQKKKEDFVYQNLKEVFAELNLAMTDEVDNILGQRLVDSEISNCAIYMSTDSSGIIFETVGEVETDGSLSANQKVGVEESARKMCQKHLEVIRRMRDRGILLHVECETKPKAENMKIVRKKATQKRGTQSGAVQYIGG